MSKVVSPYTDAAQREAVRRNNAGITEHIEWRKRLARAGRNSRQPVCMHLTPEEELVALYTMSRRRIGY